MPEGIWVETRAGNPDLEGIATRGCRMKPLLLVGTAALALAGCHPETAKMPDRDACGAAAYADLVGTHHEAHDFTQPGRALRIIAPDSAVTMDYNPERLNVAVDKDGVITRIWCG